MELVREKIEEEIRNIKVRISKTLDKYYEEYYIHPSRTICKDIYNNLSKAFVSNGKLLCRYYSEDTNLDGFEYEDESEILKICIRNAEKSLLNHYNIDISKDVIAILLKIMEYSKICISDDNLEEINDIIDEIEFCRYLKSHEEYKKVKDLFYILYSAIDEANPKRIQEMLGYKAILEIFEENLSIISLIEDKYFRSAVCQELKEEF